MMEPESQSKSMQARDDFRRLAILIAVATLDLMGGR